MVKNVHSMLIISGSYVNNKSLILGRIPVMYVLHIWPASVISLGVSWFDLGARVDQLLETVLLGPFKKYIRLRLSHDFRWVFIILLPCCWHMK